MSHDRIEQTPRCTCHIHKDHLKSVDKPYFPPTFKQDRYADNTVLKRLHQVVFPRRTLKMVLPFHQRLTWSYLLGGLVALTFHALCVAPPLVPSIPIIFLVW